MEEQDPCCICEEEATVGVTAVVKGIVVHASYCEKHYRDRECSLWY